MQYTWVALHESLMQTIHNIESYCIYRMERQNRFPLKPFKDPVSVVNYLTDLDADYDFKDIILAELVEIAQQKNTHSLGLALLFLGLWPRLNRFYRRNRSDYKNDPGPLVSELWDCFTLVVSRARLERINKVAATLSMNTKRTYYYRRQRQRSIRKREMPLRRCDEFNAIDNIFVTIDVSDFGIVPGLSRPEEMRRLRDLLNPILGDNANLMMEKVVYGEEYKELCQRHGISNDASRKRFQRAKETLKKELGINIKEITVTGKQK